MYVGTPNNQQKKPTLFSPRQSQPAANSPARITPTPASVGPSRKCCRFNDCIIVSPHHQPTPKNDQKVVELEKQIQREKELRAMYKLRMERTQDYLRFCLQIAQDHGFLDLMIKGINNNNNNINFSPSSSSPPAPPLPVNSTDLADLTHQAKINGWFIHRDEIVLQEKVGEGTTADVFKATWRGFDVAVKCIFPDFFNSNNENGVSFFAQEVHTLSKQRHRFVLQFMGACLDPPDHGWVVTEFMSMTLKEWLHGPGSRRKERRVPLPPLEERLQMAVEIAQAMQYLHDHNIPKVIHRDLKPSNIFLDDAMHVRVADFGHARFLTDDQKALSGEIGTHVYMAPEVVRCEPYDEKCDVYSFGIILNELITGQYPYIETDYGASRIAMEVAEGNLRPALPAEYEDKHDVINLVQLSWDEDPSKRPSFAAITTTLRAIQETLFIPSPPPPY